MFQISLFRLVMPRTSIFHCDVGSVSLMVIYLVIVASLVNCLWRKKFVLTWIRNFVWNVQREVILDLIAKLLWDALWASLCNKSGHLTVMHRKLSDIPNCTSLQKVYDVKGKGNILNPSVPVSVVSRRGQKVETCAALDSWSSGRFLSRSLCNKLGCVGTLRWC